MKFSKHTVVQGENFSVYFEDLATPKKQVSFDDHFYRLNKIQQACTQDICKHSEEKEIPFTENEIQECVSSLTQTNHQMNLVSGFRTLEVWYSDFNAISCENVY